MTKGGAGVLTLTAANTYTGKTYLTGGTIAIVYPVQTGLYEGLVNNNNSAIDTSDPIPHTSIQSVARWGASTNSGGSNVYPAWGTNTTPGLQRLYRQQEQRLDHL